MKERTPEEIFEREAMNAAGLTWQRIRLLGKAGMYVAGLFTTFYLGATVNSSSNILD